jgi:hypothetical protein
MLESSREFDNVICQQRWKKEVSSGSAIQPKGLALRCDLVRKIASVEHTAESGFEKRSGICRDIGPAPTPIPFKCCHLFLSTFRAFDAASLYYLYI